MSLATISITNEKLNKHLDSCTPVRRDHTPRDQRFEVQSQAKLDNTPSKALTPHNMKLRL